MSFAGEIRINDDVKLSGFRAGGLFIKVSLCFSLYTLRLLTRRPTPSCSVFLFHFAGLHRLDHPSTGSSQVPVLGAANGRARATDDGCVESRRGRVADGFRVLNSDVPFSGRRAGRTAAIWRIQGKDTLS